MKIKVYLAVAIVMAMVMMAWVSAKESSDTFDKGLFWKIEKDGEYVGHIFGTLHMNDERIGVLHEKVNKMKLSKHIQHQL